MPRRMQVNLGRINSYHLEEHDESRMCQYHPRCRPVEEKTVSKLHPPVPVPAFGVHLVIDGVEVAVADVAVTPWLGGSGTTYILRVPNPKPTFFEPGKTYRRHCQWSIWAQKEDVIETFKVTVIEKDGSGKPVAFGRLIVADTDRWITLHGYDNSTALRQGQWEEVTK